MKRQAKKKIPTPSGTIRIIAGQWRGRKLPVLDVNGLRPTTDRTKETLFNWLAPYIAGRHCLDAFSGSGGLGFEALSRHAASVLLVELNASAARQINLNRQTLGLQETQAKIVNQDISKVLPTLEQQFDLIFVDPPFNLGLLEPFIQQINKLQRLAPGGLIYIESEIANSAYVTPADWHLLKERQTKQFCYRLFEREKQIS